MTELDIRKDLERNNQLTGNKKVDDQTLDLFNRIEEILA